MRTRSLSIIPSLLLLLVLPTARAEHIALPTHWAEDVSARYQAEWQRQSDPGSPLAATMANEAYAGAVEIRVTSATPEWLRLNWRPIPGKQWRPEIKKSTDFAVAGTILWRHLRTLQQALVLTPDAQGAMLQLENAEVLRNEARDEIHRVLSQLDIDIRCAPESTDVLCARVANAEIAASWTLQASAPFFNCVGLVVDSKQPTHWRVPFQIDTSLQAEPIESAKEFTAEVLNFDPNATELHIRLLETRDDAALLKLVDRYAGQMDPKDFAQMRAGVTANRYHYQTDCRMDRKTGWPIEVTYTIGLSSVQGGGSEKVHYLRTK